MHTTYERCLSIEEAENGWIVVEALFARKMAPESDESDGKGYDPSRAFSEEKKSEDVDPNEPLSRTIHVFSLNEHDRLLDFVREKTFERIRQRR